MNQEDSKIFNQIISQNKIVVGIDEAGRGPLAGPLVVGAVIYNPTIDLAEIGVNDSKLLTDKKRRNFFEILQNQIQWSVGVIEPKFIDEFGITKSVSYGVELALNKLNLKPDFLMLDGKIKFDPKIKQQEFIKGDRRFELIGAASIMAKVWRDDLMIQYDEKFKDYNFAKHKGYGTREHYELIKKFGPCEIHRRSFRLK